MEDVPIFRHKQRPPIAKPEDLDDEVLPRNKASNKIASFTSSLDEEIQEEEVKFYCTAMFLSIDKNAPYHTM